MHVDAEARGRHAVAVVDRPVDRARGAEAYVHGRREVGDEHARRTPAQTCAGVARRHRDEPRHQPADAVTTGRVADRRTHVRADDDVDVRADDRAILQVGHEPGDSPAVEDDLERADIGCAARDGRDARRQPGEDLPAANRLCKHLDWAERGRDVLNLEEAVAVGRRREEVIDDGRGVARRGVVVVDDEALHGGRLIGHEWVEIQTQFEPVVDAVPVRVGRARVSAQRDFLTVEQGVAVGVGGARVGVQRELLKAGQAVAVRVLRRVAAVVRVQAVDALIVVGHPVPIGVGGNSYVNRDGREDAFVARRDYNLPAPDSGDKPVVADGGDVRVARRVGRAVASVGQVFGGVVGQRSGGGQLCGLAGGGEQNARGRQAHRDGDRVYLAADPDARQVLTVQADHWEELGLPALRRSVHVAADDAHAVEALLDGHVGNGERAVRVDLHGAILDARRAVLVERRR